MKYDPSKKALYTGNGNLIKKLECPINVSWDDLKPNIIDKNTRDCANCQKQILDTSSLSEEDLLNYIQSNPNTCMSIDLLNRELEIITDFKIQVI